MALPEASTTHPTPSDLQVTTCLRNAFKVSVQPAEDSGQQRAAHEDCRRPRATPAGEEVLRHRIWRQNHRDKTGVPNTG
ncbi:hypothetical protein L596_025469 [Steinernema carpocapsae]|uniref:Uncharacterized protein n=1 Tax=Steinernema carpocapsae TaxID=34508 RepID=A0A4V5ZYT9_STECR|nr:hypothetical protein L596_025469 [Steinernema carpocapsae]